MNTLIKRQNIRLFKNNYLFSNVFRNIHSQKINLYDKEELVYKKDNNSTSFFENSLNDSNIKKIGVIGWGSQGKAQAQNLRDTINKLNMDIPITIGLRDKSSSIIEAKQLGFKVDNIKNVLGSCDLNLLLVSDYAQCKNYEKYFSYLKKGSTLGLSHGFLLGHLNNLGKDFPNNNIILVAPKGMGITVRNEYVKGSGINSSYSVYKDNDKHSKNLALSWAYGIGSPQIFETSLENEYISDIFGERAILLGGLHGIMEYLYRKFYTLHNNEYSYNASVNYIVNDLSQQISKNGLKHVYDNMTEYDKSIFDTYYSKSYCISKNLFEEIYDEVKSGNELNSVILNSNRPISDISNSKMWKNNKNNKNEILDNNTRAIVSGVYIGCMMSQVDILMKNNHSYSEIVNESIIEAVDSLNPFMANYGISNMIDNCSNTARLGARKWASRLDYLLEQNMDNNMDSKIKSFIDHPIHDVYKIIRNIR